MYNFPFWCAITQMLCLRDGLTSRWTFSWTLAWTWREFPLWSPKLVLLFQFALTLFLMGGNGSFLGVFVCSMWYCYWLGCWYCDMPGLYWIDLPVCLNMTIGLPLWMGSSSTTDEASVRQTNRTSTLLSQSDGHCPWQLFHLLFFH